MKPGYRPPEDVEVYKNHTAESWKHRGKGGVPGAEAVGDDKLPPHKAAVAAAKNAKRREARKKATATVKDGGNDGGDRSEERQKRPEAETVDPEVEAAKDAKRLAKKLRQARELKDKKEKGDNLLPEQFAKVIKIHELIRQLDILGFDAEGEKKVDKEVDQDFQDKKT